MRKNVIFAYVLYFDLVSKIGLFILNTNVMQIK